MNTKIVFLRPPTESLRTRLAAVAVVMIAAGNALKAQNSISYTEYRFGFEVQLPPEWSFDRSRFIGPNDSIGLLSGASHAGHRTLQVTVHRLDAPVRFVENEVSAFEKRLANVPGTVRCESRIRATPRGSDLILTADGAVNGVAARRHYYCANIDPKTVYVLAIAAVGGEPADLASAEQEFRAAYESLRITYQPDPPETLAQAARRGVELAGAVARRSLAELPVDGPERFYEVSFESKPVGYFSSRLQRQSRREGGKVRRGARLRERGWMFQGGAARQTRVDSFLTDDGLTELTETQVTYYPPADSAAGTVVALDQCIREGDSLVSTFSVSNRADAQTRTPVGTPPDYLPVVWSRCVPELLGRTAGEPCAFQVYDAELRGLSTVRARCLGDRELPGTEERATVYEWRDGFAPAAALLYVDQGGQLLRLDQGPTQVTSVAQSAVEERFGPMREAVERRWRPAQRSGAP